MKILVVYKSGRFDEFDNVKSVAVSLGPSKQVLSPQQIKELEMLNSQRDIYVFNDQSHLIDGGSIERITVSD